MENLDFAVGMSTRLQDAPRSMVWIPAGLTDTSLLSKGNEQQSQTKCLFIRRQSLSVKMSDICRHKLDSLQGLTTLK
jgi:hypothetical protein